MNIPDHPAIACALRTGYPEQPEEPLRCEQCGCELVVDDDVYIYDGSRICEDCCKENIVSELSAKHLSELVGIDSMKAYMMREQP